ncbi:hypothetical protein RN346_01565 [Halomonas sp. PAMB 3232]|uniref:hypothetical protein n=1 Tax=Halomonas sp. PAMB 3232 TaxID=3075221 RepID=UPI00289F77BF|nr:hypothetical protein [Halomonas sp. PAMB 3232]WNL39267.1 hypothetical protein RN346_01565 [Halomonas sp. PAMB 3232]
MLIALVYGLIFVGVTATLYQLYAVNYAINFDNAQKLSSHNRAKLARLDAAAGQGGRGENAQAETFDHAVEATLGEHFDKTLAREAIENDDENAARALLRRHATLRFGTRVSARMGPLGRVHLPKRDWRALFITLVIINSLIAQFLGGMSIYTLLYPVQTPALAWLNEPVILMGLIFLLLPVNHLLGRLDFYLNDLYRIGQLTREKGAKARFA